MFAESRAGQRLPAERGEPTPQTLAKRGPALAAARIEIGAAERAAGGERAHAFTAIGADMGAIECHTNSKQHAHMRWLRFISAAPKTARCTLGRARRIHSPACSGGCVWGCWPLP